MFQFLRGLAEEMELGLEGGVQKSGPKIQKICWRVRGRELRIKVV